MPPDLCTVVDPKTAPHMSAPRKIDFHCHSHFSDGSLAPEELVRLALQREITHLSITDHDTVAAYSRTLEVLAANEGLSLITGCELSCQWQRRNIHIVGLNMDLRHAGYRQAMQQQSQARLGRGDSICAALQGLGFDVNLAAVQDLAAPGMIGRPHFAQYLVETQQMPSLAAAFKHVLGSGKAGDIKANWPGLETAVGWITQAGGVAVVAHPLKYKMTLTKLRSLLADFVAAGGQAMEVVTGHQDSSPTRTLADLAQRFDLHASAGSDFHRPGQPWAELGHVQPLPDRCQPVWELWS